MEFYSNLKKEFRENSVQCNLVPNALVSRNFCGKHSKRKFPPCMYCKTIYQIVNRFHVIFSNEATK